MLNLGMTEILCFSIIALLVLGPDKLPEAARFAAKWYGKIKRFVSNIQNEIDRELKLSEFREEMQKEIEKITELERRMQQQLDQMKNQSVLSDESEASEPVMEVSAHKTYLPYQPEIFPPFTATYLNSNSQCNLLCSMSSHQNSELKIAV